MTNEQILKELRYYEGLDLSKEPYLSRFALKQIFCCAFGLIDGNNSDEVGMKAAQVLYKISEYRSVYSDMFKKILIECHQYKDTCDCQDGQRRQLLHAILIRFTDSWDMVFKLKDSMAMISALASMVDFSPFCDAVEKVASDGDYVRATDFLKAYFSNKKIECLSISIFYRIMNIWGIDRLAVFFALPKGQDFPYGLMELMKSIYPEHARKLVAKIGYCDYSRRVQIK